MGERSKHPPGTPSWADLASPDPDASARFYGELFGWTTTEAGPVEETGGYRMFQRDGRAVAGLGPLQGEGQPPIWTTYVTVADAGETAEKVRGAGGTVLMEPFDVLTAGRMAVFADATGAAFAVWEPKEHIGAEVVNDVGAMCWNELQTRDVDGAKAFYAAVFGWQGDTETFDAGGASAATYTTWHLDGRRIGGMVEMDENWPADVPANWMVYFSVDDADAAAKKTKGAGGSLHVPPTDVPGVGRFAVLGDPQGAHLGVIKLAQIDP